MKTLISIVSIILFAGCSGNSGQTIEGKVVFEDGSPLGLGAVILTDGKNSYSGAVNSDGSYKIEKVLSSEYKVAISGAVIGGTKSTEFQMDYDANGNYIEPPAAQPPVPLVKEHMADPEKSGLTLKVPGDYQIKVQKP